MKKADNFLRSAKRDLDEQNFDAALVMAIQAGIAANDAACIALGRRRAADEDHHRAVDLLRELGGSSSEVNDKARQLEWLIGRKTASEYGDAPATSSAAADACLRAERLVAWAIEQVAKAFPRP